MMPARRIITEINVAPSTREWQRRGNETPEACARRLCRDNGRVEALNLARTRAATHAPKHIPLEVMDDPAFVWAFSDHEAKRCKESFLRWCAVVRVIKGMLTKAERVQAGLLPVKSKGQR